MAINGVVDKSKPIQNVRIPVKKVTAQELVVRRRFVRTPPDKVRLVSGLIIGKKPEVALEILQFTPKAAVKPLILALKSAISLAKDTLNSSDLVIKQVRVDEGPKLKRRRIIHRGRATSILKRMSHITVVLSDNGNSKLEARNSKQIPNNNNQKVKI